MTRRDTGPKLHVPNPDTAASRELPRIVEAIHALHAEVNIDGRSAAGDSYYLRISCGDTSTVLRVSDHPSFTHAGPDWGTSIETIAPKLDLLIEELQLLEVERLGQPPITQRQREDDFLNKFAALRSDPNTTKDDIAAHFGRSFRELNEKRRDIQRRRRRRLC